MTTGDKLISGSDDKTIKIWSTTSWTCERTLTEHTGSVFALALHEGKLLSGSDDKSVKIWDLTTWACERTLQFSDYVCSLKVLCGDELAVGHYGSIEEKMQRAWPPERPFARRGTQPG